MSQLSTHDKAVLNCIFNPNLPLDEVYKEELSDDVKDVCVDTPEVIRSKDLECKAIQLTEDERFDEALRVLDEAVKLTPERSSPYNNKAQVHQLKGDTSSAFEDLSKAIIIGSRNDERRTLCQAYCQRGLLNRKENRIDAARDDFNHAAKLGSFFAKNQLVELNPYAALCNQMLRQAFDSLKLILIIAAEELLTPTKIYVKALKEVIKKYVKAFAHVIGGLLENIPCILLKNLTVELNSFNWKIPNFRVWNA
ncbi:hypothetical protein FQR65_LT11185 [Abscondita terminalis]|nr:hypothetical protein FQR65_LT11185 [Abscondita terminalis]